MIRILRLGLVVVSLVAAAWFAVGLRQAHEIDAASTLLDQHAGNSVARGRHIASLLSSADFLNPDVEVTLLRAQLDTSQRKFAAAKILVDRAIAAEPGNLNVWISALHLAIDNPSAESTPQIIRHLRQLDPVDASGL